MSRAVGIGAVPAALPAWPKRAVPSFVLTQIRLAAEAIGGGGR